MRGQSNGKTLVALLLILILGVILRILAFGGYHGSDDSGYAQIAHAISTGTYISGDYSALPIFKLRFGVTVPAAVGFTLFGINEYVLTAYPFILSLLGILVAFFIGRLIYDEKTGLIAALIQAVVPLDVRMASELQPNLPGAFWANLGILLLILAATKDQIRSKLGLTILAGVGFGISWLCKSSVIYLFPFIIGYGIWLVVCDKKNRVVLPTFLITFIAILFLEALFHYSYTHDPFFRYNVTEENYRLSKTWFFAEGTPFGWASGHYYEALWKRILIAGPKVIFLETQFGGVTILALLTAIYAIFSKRRELLLPALWFFSLVILFNFGSTSFQAYTPLPLFPAHLFPLILPAVLIVSGLFRSSESVEKSQYGLNFMRIFVIILIFVLSCNGFWRNFLDGPQSRLEAGSSKIAGPADLVYTDNRTMVGMEFFWGYPDEANIRDFQGMGADEIPGGSYVLINRSRLSFLSEFYGYQLPEFYETVPDGWIKEFENRDGELYFVN